MKTQLWKEMCRLLNDKVEFVIATIASHKGSTPRTSGTKMIITGDGKISGTIGGGLLEARVMEKAAGIINNPESPKRGRLSFMPFDLSHEDVETMDMICGGQAEIILDHVIPSPENTPIFEKWQANIEKREKGFFITVFLKGGGSVYHGLIEKSQMFKGEQMAGDMPLSQSLTEKIIVESRNTPAMKILEIEGATVLIEPSLKPKTAFLLGAGHVSRPTAQVCALTGFYVTVLDDREEFANAENFPEAQNIVVLDDFEDVFNGLEVDEDAFIVIFTRGHLHDRVVLAQALKTNAAYIGMIGSKTKRDNIYKALMNIGYTQEDIDRVHSPIGLSIGAQTPEEIAVSIVAEMIQERAEMAK